MSIERRLRILEATQTTVAARVGKTPWWAQVPVLVVAYLEAQEPAVEARFAAHLEAMQALPGNRDGFRYYQTFTRPWRPGEDRFVPPGLMVWDAVFRTGGELTLRSAQVEVLACGLGNLEEALRDEVPGAAREAAWSRLAGGKLCEHRDCLCFHRYHFRCHDPEVPLAAWRARGTHDPATLAQLGFGAPELALLATDEGGDHGA